MHAAGRALPIEEALPTRQDQQEVRLKVLVVGSGLGTNSGLGLEVPEFHGKYVTDGLGGVVEVSPHVRKSRAQWRPAQYMGRRYDYLWEREGGYMGNGGYLYGALAFEKNFDVDVLDHPFSQDDQTFVGAMLGTPDNSVDCSAQLAKERASMWEEHESACDSYARSVARRIMDQKASGNAYDVILAGSKGITQVCRAVIILWGAARRDSSASSEHLDRSSLGAVGIVLINGGEPCSWDLLEQKSSWSQMVLKDLIGHAKVRALVLTSHGGCPDATLRHGIGLDAADNGLVPAQSVVLYSAIDNRIAENHEAHDAPWSLMCPPSWFKGESKPKTRVLMSGRVNQNAMKELPQPYLNSLVWWAGTLDEARLIAGLYAFPGPPRFAELRVELFEDASEGCRKSSRRGRKLTLQPPLESSVPIHFLACQQVCSGEAWDIYFDARSDIMDIVLRSVIDSNRSCRLQDLLHEEGQFARRILRFFRVTSSADEGDIVADNLAQDIAVHEFLALNKNMGNFMWLLSPAIAEHGDIVTEIFVETELGRMQSPYNGFKASRLENEWRLRGKSPCSILYDLRRLPATIEKTIDHYEHRLVDESSQEPQQNCGAVLRNSDHLYSGWRIDVDGVVWFSAPADARDSDFVSSSKNVRECILEQVTKLRCERGHISIVHESWYPPDFFDRHGFMVRQTRRTCLSSVNDLADMQQQVNSKLSALRPHMPMSTMNLCVDELMRLSERERVLANVMSVVQQKHDTTMLGDCLAPRLALRLLVDELAKALESLRPRSAQWSMQNYKLAIIRDHLLRCPAFARIPRLGSDGSYMDLVGALAAELRDSREYVERTLCTIWKSLPPEISTDIHRCWSAPELLLEDAEKVNVFAEVSRLFNEIVGGVDTAKYDERMYAAGRDGDAG